MFVNDFLLFIDKFTKEDDKEGKRTKDDAGAAPSDRPGLCLILRKEQGNDGETHFLPVVLTIARPEKKVNSLGKSFIVCLQTGQKQLF